MFNQYSSSKILVLCAMFSFAVVIDANTLARLQSTTSVPDQQVSVTENLEDIFEAQVCTTEECIRSATDIRSVMNTTVDPCDDFYEFSCGRWGAENSIQLGYTESSAITISKQKLLNDVLTLLKSNGTADEPTPLQKSRDLFQSCMDQESRDSLRYDSVFKYLSLLGLPAVPRFFNLSETDDDLEDYKFDWMKTDSAFFTLFRVPLLVHCEVAPNMFNSSHNVFSCKTPKQKFKFHNVELIQVESDRLFDVDIFAKNQTDIQEAWHKLTNFTITTLIKEKFDLPEDFQESFDAAMEVINKTETFISEVKNLTRNLQFTYVSLESIEDLQTFSNYYVVKNNITPKLIWTQYLEESFSHLNLTLNLNKYDDIFISRQDKFYYRAINSMVSKTSDAKLELWAWWRAVLNLIIHTTFEASEYVDDIFNVTSVNHELSRELVCTRLTTYRMDLAIAYSLTDEYFLNVTKPNVKEIWHNITEAFELRVKSITWMDENTKNLTIEKSRAMKEFIGYPEWLQNKTLLESFYSPITINADTYLDNIIEFNKFKTKLNFKQFYLVNNKQWPGQVNVMVINAHYSAFSNVIAVPFAIIKYLFYNHGLEALNYGSMGAVLGHELTHGFDNKGRNFDKDGTYGTWWSKTTFQDFSNMTECFVDQYDQFYVPEANDYINGSVTLGENLADSGGLHHAYIAYQNQKKNSEELKLPGLEQFTNDQLFFMSYANFWCSERLAKEPMYQMKDVHCPDKFRVLGNLMNSKEFATAFNCPLGSNMNPKKSKCKIW